MSTATARAIDFGTASMHANLPVPRLVELALARGEGVLASNGAITCDTGDRTGRSPNDKFLEDTAGIHGNIDWGKVQTIPDSALTSAPMAQPRTGWLLWDFRGSGRIFVVGDDGALHHIPDMETFLARFEWKNVLPVSAGQVRQLPAGAGIATVK